LLQCVRSDGDRGSAHSQHLRKELLGEGQLVSLLSILRLQQPAGEPCFRPMRRVAGRGLLQVGEHDVVGASGDVSERNISNRSRLKCREGHSEGYARKLDNRGRKRKQRQYAYLGPDCSLAADPCYLDFLAGCAPAFRAACSTSSAAAPVRQ
jgi:hypothetical protein